MSLFCNFTSSKFQVINCLLATNFRDRPYVDINLKKNTSDSQLEYAAMYILEYNIFFHVKLPVLGLVYRFCPTKFGDVVREHKPFPSSRTDVCMYYSISINNFFTLLVLQLDTPQDVSNIPIYILYYILEFFFSLIVQTTSQDPSISIDRARTLVLFQQKGTCTWYMGLFLHLYIY